MRSVSEPSIALAVTMRGRDRSAHAEQQHLVERGDLMLVDLTAPERDRSEPDPSYAVRLPVELLGFPDARRTASTGSPSSSTGSRTAYDVPGSLRFWSGTVRSTSIRSPRSTRCWCSR